MLGLDKDFKKFQSLKMSVSIPSFKIHFHKYFSDVYSETEVQRG
jgi:hypothetical protein